MLKFRPEAPKLAPKQPRRYRGAELGIQISVRLQPELLARVDSNKPEGMTRPEAIRLLIEKALG